MGSLIIGAIFAIAGIIALFVPIRELKGVKKIAAAILFIAGGGIAVTGAVEYNDAGYCQHIRTAFGSEDYKCDLGWYAVLWGQSTQYPHYITVSHTSEPTTGSVSDMAPYTIRMADNWTGTVHETTRFGIPQDREQFLKMARDFRSPERLIVTTLRPAVTASLDSIASLFTMEDYWNAKRDQFKTEYQDAIIKGRPSTVQKTIVVANPNIDTAVAPSDSPNAQDTADTGESETTVTIAEKVTDHTGREIRVPHNYLEYGITVSSAIIEQVDPDDRFEEQIQKRKDAAARRIIAREQRREQEEQRLLTIAEGERNIAQRQAEARTNQIEQTTNAETEKKLSLINAEKVRDQAAISKQTSQINLEKAEIDAEALRVTADAQAYERQQLLEADNALQLKLDTEKAIQQVWADAYAKRNVPQIVLGGGANGDGAPVGADSEVSNIMNMLQVDMAKRLSYDRGIDKIAAQ